jgi:hypothetical protein
MKLDEKLKEVENSSPAASLVDLSFPQNNQQKKKKSTS